MRLFPLSSIFLRPISFLMVAGRECAYFRDLPRKKDTPKGLHDNPNGKSLRFVGLASPASAADVNVFRYSDIAESLRSPLTMLTCQQKLICRGKAPSNGFPLRFTPRVSSKTTLGSGVTLARSSERLLLQFPVSGTDSKAIIGYCPF
jgi:hypothetical protein